MTENGDRILRPALATYQNAGAVRRVDRRFSIILIITAVAAGGLFAAFASTNMMLFLSPLGVLALLAVWLLPEQSNPPIRLAGIFMMAFFLALLLWPDYLAISLAGLPWITMLRLVAIPWAVVFLVCMSTSAVQRQALAESLREAPVIWKLLLGFFATAVVSVPFSGDIALSMDKITVALFYWLLPFFCAALIFRREGMITIFYRILMICLVIFIIMAFFEAENEKVLWVGHIPSFLKVEDESVARILAGGARAASGLYRVQGKFSTALGLAEMLALIFPFVVHTIIFGRRFLWRAVALLSVPVIFYTIRLTDSRLGVVGFFSTLLAYLWLWAAYRRLKDSQHLIAPAILVAYPVIVFLFYIATLFIRRLHHMVWGGGAQQFSTESRMEQYVDGFPKIITHPLGHGLGRGAEVLGHTNLAGVLTIDTYYLSVALECGILGFITFYGCFLAGIIHGAKTALKARTHEMMFLMPTVVALINFVIIKSVLSQYDNHPMVFGMLGIIMALSWRINQAEKSSAGPARKG
jgi:hypothetical protein